MNRELYRLLKEYGKLDSDFIKSAYDIMMEAEPDLDPFVKQLEIYDDPETRSLGSYSLADRKILINKENINNAQEKNKKVIALRTLRHEIEHAKQYEKLEQRRTDIESLLLICSHKDYALEHGITYHNREDKNDYFSLWFKMRKQANYDRDPSERIAEIKACKFVVNLLKNQRITPDLLDARTALYYAYIRGYDDQGWALNPPTYEYLLKMGMLQDFYMIKTQVERQRYVFETRLMYGLPLREGEEYDKKILQKVLLRKSKRQ